MLWSIELRNPGRHPLEVGELGIRLPVNDDYEGLYDGVPAAEALKKSVTAAKQRAIHEQKVFAHHYIGGHSSYTLVQRPMGDPLMLLIHPAEGTPLECYNRKPGSKVGVLTVHSWANVWLRMQHDFQTPWVNGHTSLVLKPQATQRYVLRFKLIYGYAAIGDELARTGNLAIRVLPSMVVPRGTPVYVEVRWRHENLAPYPISDGIHVVRREKKSGADLFTFSFAGPGQKTVQFRYGSGCWSNIQLYCTEDTGRLLDARSAFIIDRRFFRDPKHPFHRDHMFLPFDAARQSTFRDSDEAWEVGGSDEYGFSEPLFLVQKNVNRPCKRGVAILEEYVNECLLRHIQDPDTFEVRASLYWKQRYPSSPWGHWDADRAATTWRTYNYVHPANIYHGLYLIGRKYRLLARRPPDEYLMMAHKTCMRWFSTGPWKHVGLMCGSNAVNILEDLKREGHLKEYSELRIEMEKCCRVFSDDPYPYGSELAIDQTAHEQVYFFSKYFGDKTKQLKTATVIKALRGGNQPFWFRYGNDKRNHSDMACWYSEALNGWALLDAFEETNDADMFIKGFAGLMSVIANLRADGMGCGWYVSTPGADGFLPPRTLDNGIGQFGFQNGVRAYVLRDPAFGVIGAGCEVSSGENSTTAVPKDGVRKRIRFVSERIEIEVSRGEIAEVTLASDGRSLSFRITDPTGLVDEAEFGVKGLKNGSWEIRCGSTRIRHDCDKLRGIRFPIEDAHNVELVMVDEGLQAGHS